MKSSTARGRVSTRAFTPFSVRTMEKDLRDAYRALTLVRADLVATRKEKAEVEERWRAFARQQREDDAQRGAQLAEIRETFLMREEDFQAQLLHMEAFHREQQQQAALKNALLMQELGSMRRDAMTEKDEASMLKMPRQEGKQPEEEDRDNQQEEHSEETEEDAETESLVREKLSLLASLYALQAQLQAQTEEIMERDAVFAQERDEWTLQNEEMKETIAALQEQAADFSREKKFLDEKFEFLRAEVDVVKKERDELKLQLAVYESVEVHETASDAARKMQEAMDESVKQYEASTKAIRDENQEQKAELQEKDHCIAELEAHMEQLRCDLEAATLRLNATAEERQTSEAEYRSSVQQLRIELGASRSSSEAAERRVRELEGVIKSLRDEIVEKNSQMNALETEKTNLIQQLQGIRDQAKDQLLAHAKEEEERTKTQLSEREKLQRELTTLLSSFEAATSENALKMSTLQRTNDALQRALTDKAHALAETREKWDRQRSRHHDVLSRQHESVEACRKDLREQRQNVLQYAEKMSAEVEEAQRKLIARFESERAQQAEGFRQELAELSSKLANAELQYTELRDQYHQAQDAANVLRGELLVSEERCATLSEELKACSTREKTVSEELEQALREVTRNQELLEKERQYHRIEQEQQLGALKTIHDRALHAATVEQNALNQQIQELKLTQYKLESNIKLAREATAEAETKLIALESTQESSKHTIRQLQTCVANLETQLMASEDHSDTRSTCTVSSWSDLSSRVRALDDFLPQLQLFAGRLQTSLHLCAENVSAMRVLHGASRSSSDPLLADLGTLAVLAADWKQLFEVKNLGGHVRQIRRTVLVTLAQWHEDGDTEDNSPPPPPFRIDSQEVAIILQNWTQDEEKRRSVAHWLKRMATTNVRSSEDDVPRDDDAGCTLEMKTMTREVKDAFCMLIIPLLKQNHAIYVRVFTRRNGDAKASYSPDEKCWEMRIHVQFVSRYSSSTRRATTAPTPFKAACEEPSTLRRASSSSSISSVGSSASSVASSLSLSSISSASKLQIIQARLQQMQQQHH